MAAEYEIVEKLILWTCDMTNSYWRMFLLFAVLLVIPSGCYAWFGKVVHVADGDTITVERGGKRAKVRLYGIDTPEKSQWYGQNAKTFTSSPGNGQAGRSPGDRRGPLWESRGDRLCW